MVKCKPSSECLSDSISQFTDNKMSYIWHVECPTSCGRESFLPKDALRIDVNKPPPPSTISDPIQEHSLRLTLIKTAWGNLPHVKQYFVKTIDKTSQSRRINPHAQLLHLPLDPLLVLPKIWRDPPCTCLAIRIDLASPWSGFFRCCEVHASLVHMSDELSIIFQAPTPISNICICKILKAHQHCQPPKWKGLTPYAWHPPSPRYRRKT